MQLVLSMPFFNLSNANIQFAEKELTWRSYTTEETLSTTRQVEIIDGKKSAKAVLKENIKAFVVHISFIGSKITIHSARKARLALLLAEKVTMPTEYSDFAEIFLKKSANILPEQTGANEHAIELKKGKQPSYGPIYSLGLVEFKTFKTYIETNLANSFIRALKSLTGALILLVRKFNSSFCFCVNYQRFNNLTFKNWYPLPLIGKSLDWLCQAKQFIQLDLTSAYHRIRIKECDEYKTAFRTWYGYFKYQVMLFGVFNAPTSFQGYINKILAEKLDIFVIIYFDNIFIYTKDSGQAHVDGIWWFLKELRKNSFVANLKKCRFHKDKVRFLGHVVSAKGVKMKEERIDAVKNWPKLKSIYDI